MTQRLEFTGYESETYSAELHAEWTDVTPLETFTAITGKTNQPSRFRITTVSESRVGLFVLIVKDGGSNIAWTYFVKLTGIENAEHECHLSKNDALDITVRYLDEAASVPAVLTDEDINSLAESPKRVTTDEGTVVERSAEDIIALANYLKAKDVADDPLHGLRVSRCKPASAS